MDSITRVEEGDTDEIVVSASYGGVRSGGITALDVLEQRGVPVGTVCNELAKIGDYRDHWEKGIISHLNEAARAAGLREGELLRESILSVCHTGSARAAGWKP